MTPEITRFIRTEIGRQLNVILSGAAGPNDNIENETINSLYPGSPQISQRPVMHPYGLASRAPSGTIQVTAKQGSDAHNRMVLGHRDTMRKKLRLDAGETAIYGSDGKTVLSRVVTSNSKGIVLRTEKAKGTIGSDGTFFLQNDQAEYTAALIQLFTDIQNGLVTTMLGGQPLVMPTFADDLTKFQSFVGAYAGGD